MRNPPETADPHQPPDLLGYHLGLLDEPAAAAVRAAFATPAELEAARRRLDRLLAPLQADVVEPPPSDLVDRVLRRVDAGPAILPFPRPAADAGPTGGPMLAFRELIGLAAAVLIFAGIFLPGYRAARMNAQQTACANNLRLIGTGLADYNEAYRSTFPIVASVPDGVPWLRPDPAPQQRVSNSQNVYQLLRGGHVSPTAFHCPSRPGDFPLSPAAAAAELHDFPDARNNSYSSLLITTTAAWRDGAFRPATPVMADLTPLVDENRRLLPDGSARLNSNSHGPSRGQNVLSADISVRFSRTPNVGIDHDDIYRVIGVQRYTGLERPRSASDAFLVP
jgi:hypothetical protein